MKAIKLIFILLWAFLLAGCAARTMRGVVIDKSGNNISDVYVQVKEVQDSKIPQQIPVAVKKTGMTGGFEVSNLRRYKTYSFTFSKKSYKDKDIVYDLRNMPKAMRESLRIELDEVGYISGTVIDRDGNGVPFVFVEVKNVSDEHVATTTTDEMGRFIIKELEGDKTYKLAFSKYGYKPINNLELNLSNLSESERIDAKIQLLKEIIEVKGTVVKLKGTSEKSLFSINSDFQKYLDAGTMTSELLQIFMANNIELKETEVIWDGEKGIWWILGKDPGDGNYFYYAVKMEMEELKVYSPTYAPFEGLDIELKKSGADDLIWKTKTDADGSFIISEQITSGAFRIGIVNSDNKYVSEKSIPSNTEYFRLESGDAIDIGVVIMKLLPGVKVKDITGDIIAPTGGPPPAHE